MDYDDNTLVRNILIPLVGTTLGAPPMQHLWTQLTSSQRSRSLSRRSLARRRGGFANIESLEDRCLLTAALPFSYSGMLGDWSFSIDLDCGGPLVFQATSEDGSSISANVDLESGTDGTGTLSVDVAISHDGSSNTYSREYAVSEHVVDAIDEYFAHADGCEDSTESSVAATSLSESVEEKVQQVTAQPMTVSSTPVISSLVQKVEEKVDEAQQFVETQTDSSDDSDPVVEYGATVETPFGSLEVTSEPSQNPLEFLKSLDLSFEPGNGIDPEDLSELDQLFRIESWLSVDSETDANSNGDDSSPLDYDYNYSTPWWNFAFNSNGSSSPFEWTVISELARSSS